MAATATKERTEKKNTDGKMPANFFHLKLSQFQAPANGTEANAKIDGTQAKKEFTSINLIAVRLFPFAFLFDTSRPLVLRFGALTILASKAKTKLNPTATTMNDDLNGECVE